MYKHILVATDGSELAIKGVDQGLALAKALGAKITVLSVVEPLQQAAAQAASAGGVDDPVKGYDHQIDEAMKQRYASIERRAAKEEVAVEFSHETDEFPAEAIVRAAKLKGCDLVVMASHGRRGIKKLLLGSQTAEVLVTTAIPVLVIR